jgi:dynein assembly factor 3
MIGPYSPAQYSTPVHCSLDHKPQQFASDGSDAVGFVQFWGNSPALDLLPKQEATAKCEEISDEPYNVLVSGACDLRHVLKTLAARNERRGTDSLAARKLHLHVHESDVETLARHVLLLLIVNDTRKLSRERAEIFISVFGNALVREKDAEAVADWVPELLNLVTDESKHPMAEVVDFSGLKFQARDELTDVFKGWKKNVQFDAEALRDQRLRGYYRERYDHRVNLCDWDWNACIRKVAPLVHWQQYKEFCLSGVSFETRLGSYKSPNRTLASYIDGRHRQKGTSILIRGFWADIINSPYFSFGCDQSLPDYLDVDERARILKKHTDSFRHTSVDLAFFAVNAFIQSLETGEPLRLGAVTKQEGEWPYESPLERLMKQPQELSETEEDIKLLQGFADVKISFMSGDLQETLKKSKYNNLFDKAYFGNMAMNTVFKAGKVVERKSESMKPFPEADYGSIEHPIAASLKPGATVVTDSFKYQVHFNGSLKLGFRRRVWEAMHYLGLGLTNPRTASPRMEPDMKDLVARALDEQGDDFLTFVKGQRSEVGSSVVHVSEEDVKEILAEPEEVERNTDLPA